MGDRAVTARPARAPAKFKGARTRPALAHAPVMRPSPQFGTVSGAPGTAPGACAITVPVRRVLSSPGQPLDAGSRAFFEPRFGVDFSNVRIHDDARAAATANTLAARAYTAGSHLVFGDGEYAPYGVKGRRLLAHELAHVAQQRGEASSISDRLVTDATAEAEADRMAEAVLANRAFTAPRMYARGIMRKPQPASLQTLKAMLIRKRIQRALLRQLMEASQDQFAKDVVGQRTDVGAAADAAQLKRQAQDDLQRKALQRKMMDPQQLAQLQRAITIETSGNTYILRTRFEISYAALKPAEAKQKAAIDIPRLTEAIHNAWTVDMKQGRYAGRRFSIEPIITHRPASQERSADALQFNVQGDDKAGASIANFLKGEVSLSPHHLKGNRIIAAAHELYHLFGWIVDMYGSQTKPRKQTTVGRDDPAGRADLLGMVDPVVLQRWLKAGDITQAQVDRQMASPRVWAEDADTILNLLDVPPVPEDKPAPARGSNRKPDRDEDIRRSIEMAERAIKLDAEIPALEKRIHELQHGSPP